MSLGRILEPDLLWTGEHFETRGRVQIDSEGRILRVGEEVVGETTDRLRGQALLPGFVNAHSHGFQRGLRGRGETFPAGAGDFWTWREAMYDLAGGLTPDRARALYRQAFREMRRAGITTVGEFHYLHHESPDSLDYAFDEVVLEAALDSGIRLALLQAYYVTGAIERPLEGSQKRFASAGLDGFWKQFDRLSNRIDEESQSLGCVAHSIRAVPLEDLKLLGQEAKQRGIVLHMHVEEQQREIAECTSTYGAPPMALLQDHLDLGPDFTAVHCTHSAPQDMQRFAATGANACLCPLTEANLGDGIADVPGIRGAGGRISLGTDSNARISMLEEARWLEYAQRLHLERRGVLRDSQGRVAVPLLESATAHGARALGLPVGRIEAGFHADFVAIDLTSPNLEGWSTDTLLVSLLLGAAEESIAGTWIGGQWQENETLD